MRPERYSYNYGGRGARISRSVKTRAAALALGLVAIALLVAAKRENVRLGEFRTELAEWVKPVVETVSLPVRGLHNLMADKRALFTAYEENKKLKDENDTLRHWQSVAQALKAENESLRKLSGYKPVEQVEYVTAQVIAQSPDAYSGTLMINAGSDQGLHSLQPVIDAVGLVGRLVDVGETQARVLLISDASSRVPVITASTRQHAILAGTGEELMRLTFVGGDAKTIQLGETIMTTSEGGLIPESVMVGTVTKRNSNGTLLVKPMRPLAQSEYVRVMVAGH